MLKGNKVILRPVEERDLNLIVRWRNDPENARFFFSPFFINTGGQKEWYQELLADRDRVFFMVDTLEGKTVGTIALDSIDWRTQQCEGGQIVLDPNERQYGYAEEATVLIIHYAFDELNMNRIYVVCYPFNQVTSLVELLGFKKEGVLRQAAFTGGKFHDKVLYGLLRDEWRSGELALSDE